MRADKDNPRQVYEDFVDWLRWHPIWIINLVLAYAYYLVTTEEI
jgi:hypothetical protein